MPIELVDLHDLGSPGQAGRELLFAGSNAAVHHDIEYMSVITNGENFL